MSIGGGLKCDCSFGNRHGWFVICVAFGDVRLFGPNRVVGRGRALECTFINSLQVWLGNTNNDSCPLVFGSTFQSPSPSHIDSIDSKERSWKSVSLLMDTISKALNVVAFISDIRSHLIYDEYHGTMDTLPNSKLSCSIC